MASPSAEHETSPGELLRSLGFHPSKALGQHFLHDRNIVRRIVTASGVANEDVVVEIGPGLGILTTELARRAKTVVAIEKDPELAAYLRETVPDNVEVVEADALAIDPGELAGPDYHVVANLPYSVANAIIRHLLEAETPARSLTVMVQREVADRIVASPPRMSLLSVAVQFYGSPRVAFRIGKGAFVPPPNVESSVVRIETAPPSLPRAAHPGFFRLVRAGFGQRRKQLANSIASGLQLPRDEVAASIRAAGISPSTRAEQLAVEDWLSLYDAFAANLDSR